METVGSEMGVKGSWFGFRMRIFQLFIRICIVCHHSKDNRIGLVTIGQEFWNEMPCRWYFLDLELMCYSSLQCVNKVEYLSRLIFLPTYYINNTQK